MRFTVFPYPARMACAVAVLASMFVRPVAAAERPAGNLLAAVRQTSMPAEVLLLGDAAVRRELSLSPAQREQLDGGLAAVALPLWLLRDRAEADRTTAEKPLVEKFRRVLDAALEKRQAARLKELVCQARGLDVLHHAEFRGEIGIDAEQSQQIERLFAEYHDKQASLVSAADVAADERQRRLREVNDDYQRKLLAAVEPPQQQKWRELRGRPFEFERLHARFCAAPPLSGADEWINGGASAAADLRGKVAAVHFWAFGCINCQRNLPAYQDWHGRFVGRGLVIVGVHTPETQAERSVENVRRKVQELQIAYPVAIDGRQAIWNAWANRIWPSVYLIDRRGFVRFWWYGELNYNGAQGEKFMRERIEQLLDEAQAG